MRKPADKVIAPVLLDNPVLSHVDIIPKTRLLYQFYSINKLTLLSPFLVSLLYTPFLQLIHSVALRNFNDTFSHRLLLPNGPGERYSPFSSSPK